MNRRLEVSDEIFSEKSVIFGGGIYFESGTAEYGTDQGESEENYGKK